MQGGVPILLAVKSVNSGSSPGPPPRWQLLQMLPYYAEQRPDARGYAANPAGSEYVDPGVGGFLSERNLLSHPSAVDARWRPLTAENIRCQRCAMWTNDPIQASSKPTDTMVTSRTSSRSCTSTTRATSCGAAAPMTPARAPRAGLRQSPPTT